MLWDRRQLYEVYKMCRGSIIYSWRAMFPPENIRNNKTKNTTLLPPPPPTNKKLCHLNLFNNKRLQRAKKKKKREEKSSNVTRVFLFKSICLQMFYFKPLSYMSPPLLPPPAVLDTLFPTQPFQTVFSFFN